MKLFYAKHLDSGKAYSCRALLRRSLIIGAFIALCLISVIIIAKQQRHHIKKMQLIKKYLNIPEKLSRMHGIYFVMARNKIKNCKKCHKGIIK